MIEPARQNQALQALHRVLTFARTMALQNQSTDRIAAVLDWAELLPKYIAADQDKTCDFRKALNAIVEKEPGFKSAVAVFDWPEPGRW